MRPQLLVGLGVLLVACGSPATSVPASPSLSAPAAVTTPSPLPSSQPASLSIASSRYGKIIVDSSGRTLYLFDAERSTEPKCYGPCAAAWPPLSTATAPVSGSDLSQGLIATALRSDGSLQVTYNGHPLYYYVGDRAPGEIKCQAVFEYGGGWYVLDAQGNKISAP